ncbi:MAG: response regulator [Nisaea sp.]|uniref:response regulator n=1 Tax=Nisaea sp. TaxID=2024842 RepID=UPI001B066365|nr:response regulator [Nisaea sp.]MBO6561539.1 response regulator [Nisaea sp.]
MRKASGASDRLFDSRSALIVEDSHLMRQLLRSLLREFGFGEIGEATDGSDAMEKLKARRYDVIICDWMMEPTDGFTFVSGLRQHGSPEVRSLPVVMLTSVSEEPQIVAARDAGVTEYLVKPVSADKLKKRLHAVFTRPRDFLATDSYVGPDRRRRQIEGPGIPARRLSDKLEARAGSRHIPTDAPTAEDYLPVLRAELKRLSALAEEIEESGGRSAEPWIMAMRIAHDLKGQASTFGYGVIAEIAARLDRLTRPVARDVQLMELPLERRIGSVRRHVDALHLIFEQGVLARSVETDALLEQLDRAITRVERDAAAQPPGKGGL